MFDKKAFPKTLRQRWVAHSFKKLVLVDLIPTVPPQAQTHKKGNSCSERFIGKVKQTQTLELILPSIITNNTTKILLMQ